MKRLIPTSDPAGRRRRISWHTDSSAPPQSIVFPPMGSSILYTFSNECLPTGCVLSILCPPWAIQTKRPRIEYGVILIYGCWPQNLIAKCLIRTIRHEHNVTIHGCINRIILIYTYINMLWVNIIIIWINRT